MALPLSFYTSSSLFSQLSNFINPGYVLTYQDTAASPLKFNGVNYTQIVDASTGSTTGTNFNYANLLEWNYFKFIGSHPYTSSESDNTRGNRLIAFPFLVKATAANQKFLLSAINLNYMTVTATSYNASNNQVSITIQNIGINTSIDKFMNTPVVLSLSSGTSDSFLGLDGTTYTYGNAIAEITGSVISYDNNYHIVVQLDNPSPTLQGNLSSLQTIAINNQKIAILPLGYSINGVDNFNVMPDTYSQFDWVYTENHRSQQCAARTNRIFVTLPNAGDSFRCYVQAEVNQHSTIPTYGVGIITSIYS